jgi:hypothetical protein
MAEAQVGMVSADTKKVHSILDSSFPVFVSYLQELTVSDQEFATYITKLKPTEVYDVPAGLDAVEVEAPAIEEVQPTSRLIDVLSEFANGNPDEGTLSLKNKTLTENGDVAFGSTGKPLMDAFYELKGSARNIEELLNRAWAVDPEATLKIIFNARSIHLGKGDQIGSYKALGWLYKYHPQTLLANLAWLARPVIEKKIKKEGPKDKSKDEQKAEGKGSNVEKDEDGDFEMVDEVEDDVRSGPKTEATFVLSAADAPLAAHTTQNDVKYGVAHGYWKDLANILLLAINDQLKADGNVKSILNVDTRKVKPRERVWDAAKAKEARHEKQDDHHLRFESRLGSDETFRALHLTIARLFASQLRADTAALASGKANKAISLAAKWCPSPSECHDKQTFIVTSIAEALFSFGEVCLEGTDSADRLTYLKHARLALRSKVLSPLRKHLAIVERDITAGAFTSIKYDRVPSLAMSRYSGLFLTRMKSVSLATLKRSRPGRHESLVRCSFRPHWCRRRRKAVAVISITLTSTVLPRSRSITSRGWLNSAFWMGNGGLWSSESKTPANSILRFPCVTFRAP